MTRNNRNDGIDVDLYFMLPALVVANDSGSCGSLDDISSFQKAWFVRPEKLANEWQAGMRPCPAWPDLLRTRTTRADMGHEASSRDASWSPKAHRAAISRRVGETPANKNTSQIRTK